MMVERAAVAVLQDLQDVLPLAVLEHGQAPVIEHQDVGAGEAAHQRAVGAVGAGQREFIKEPRQPPVEHAIALAAGLLGEGAGQVGLADAGRAGDEDVLVPGNPLAGGQLPAAAAARRPRLPSVRTSSRQACGIRRLASFKRRSSSRCWRARCSASTSRARRSSKLSAIMAGSWSWAR